MNKPAVNHPRPPADIPIETQFSNLVHTVKDYAIFITDPYGIIMTWNEGAKNIKGYDAEEIVGLSISVLYTKEDNEKALFAKNLSRSKEQGTFEDEGWRVRKDGSLFWANVVFTNLYNEQDILTGFAIITRDISHQKLMNDDLIRKAKMIENNEHIFSALIKNGTDGIIVLSADSKPLYVSPSVKKILGYTEADIMEMDLMTITHPGDIAALSIVMEQVLANPGVTMKGHTGQMRHKDGTWRWLEATVTNLLHDPVINGIVDNFRDITERKISEEKIIHLNRVYAFLSQINQAIVHSTDEQTVFKEACRIAIDICKFTVAWIGIIDVEHETINLVEGFGLLAEDISKFKDVIYKENGPQSHVLNTGSYYVCNNISEDLQPDEWKPFATKNGFCSCLVLPLRRSGEIIGSFNLYAAEPDFFTEDEILLLEQATSEISFALDSFEKQKQKLQADELIKHKELRLNQAQAIAHIGSWELDFCTGIYTWSQETLRIHGLPMEQTAQTYTSWMSFIHPDDIEHVSAVTREAGASLGNASFAYRIVRKDGTIRHLFSQSQFEFDDNKVAIGLYGITHDVTEIKEAEEALRNSESNLLAIFENVSDGFILLDPTGIVKAFNNKSKDITLLNTGKEITIGSSIFDFVHEDRKGNYEGAISKVLSGEILQYDYPFTSANGETKWFSFTFNPVYKREKIEGFSITSTDISDRKSTELKLHDEEAQLRDYFENAHEAIVVMDMSRNGTFRRFNNNALKLFKFLPEELYSKTPQDVSPVFQPDGRRSDEKALELINSAMAGNKPVFEWLCQDAEGNELLCEARLVRLSGYYEQHLLVSFIDITERKKGELEILKLNEEVAKSEKFFKGVIENSADMITLVDATGKRIYASPAVAKIFGYTIEEFLSLNITERVHPEDLVIKQDSLGKVMAHPGVPVEVPLIRERKKDGTYMWVEATITNFLETEGINAIVANFRDVTERKKADEANRFKANLLNTIGQAAIATDLEGVVNYWNQAAENIYGWTRKEAIGRNIIQLTPADTTREQALEIMEDLKNGRTWSGEFRVQRKDGTDFPALVTDSPIYDEHNKLTGIIGISSDITEKKNLEVLLNKSNQLARIGNWEVDLLNNTLYWSDITKEIHEVSSDFIPDLETAIGFYKAGPGRDAITLAIQETIEKNTPFDLELKLVTFKRKERWIRAIGAGEFINGKCIRLYGSFQDIDKRKINELAVLKISEEKNTILESIADAFFAVDKNWVVTYWNNHAEKMLMTAKADILGRHLWDIFSDSVHSESYKKYHQAVENNEVIRFEDYYLALGKWYEISAYPSENGLSVYFKNITERKQAEQQIRYERNLLRTLIDTLPDTIYFKDKSARKVISNKSDYELLGLKTEAEVLGKTDLELLPANEGAICYDIDMEILRTGNPLFNYEEYFINERNKPVWLLTTKLPLFNEQREIIGLLGIGRDITERKIAEQKLMELNGKLEINVKQLVISNSELEQFAYVASHDLQEPLRMVISFLSQLEKKYTNIFDDKGKQYIHFAVDGAKRMRRIILDLLEFSRVGQSDNKQEEVDINNLVAEVLTLLHKHIKEKKAVIIIDKLPVIKTFASPMMQVFQNLISNSLTYHKEGKPQINIIVKDIGKFWQFAVADNGIGIDPEYFDKIFTIFQRLHNKDEYSGTGIGLAITKKIIERMGGKIWVESQEGKGSTFYFTITK